MSAATARREALTSELARRIVLRDTTVARVVREAPAAYASLREQLCARVSDHLIAAGSLARAVLVVEDDPDVRDLFALSLRAHLGVPVWTAGDAAEARAQVAAHRPAVVVVDLHLGAGETGDALLLSLDRGVRGVLVSGVADLVTLRLAAARCGAVALRKPPDGLMALARRLLDEACPPLWVRADTDTLRAVSPDLARLLGTTPQALAGIPWRSLVHPDDVARALAERARRKGLGVEGFVQRMRRTDGSYVALAWDVTPQVDGSLYAIARLVD
jgi:CheY-like chemotaxis protein